MACRRLTGDTECSSGFVSDLVAGALDLVDQRLGLVHLSEVVELLRLAGAGFASPLLLLALHLELHRPRPFAGALPSRPSGAIVTSCCHDELPEILLTCSTRNDRTVVWYTLCWARKSGLGAQCHARTLATAVAPERPRQGAARRLGRPVEEHAERPLPVADGEVLHRPLDGEGQGDRLAVVGVHDVDTLVLHKRQPAHPAARQRRQGGDHEAQPDGAGRGHQAAQYGHGARIRPRAGGQTGRCLVVRAHGRGRGLTLGDNHRSRSEAAQSSTGPLVVSNCMAVRDALSYVRQPGSPVAAKSVTHALCMRSASSWGRLSPSGFSCSGWLSADRVQPVEHERQLEGVGRPRNGMDGLARVNWSPNVRPVPPAWAPEWASSSSMAGPRTPSRSTPPENSGSVAAVGRLPGEASRSARSRQRVEGGAAHVGRGRQQAERSMANVIRRGRCPRP